MKIFKRKKRENKRSLAVAFREQRLPAWKPILTPNSVVLLYFVIFVISTPIGIVVLISSSQVREYKSDNYAELCKNNSTCMIPIEIKENLSGPVFFWYEINGFHQNYRRYVSSRENEQLRAQVFNYSQVTACTPLISLSNSHLQQDVYLPCGLVASSHFNDTFELLHPDGTVVPWTKEGIAYSVDVNNLFKNPPPNIPGIWVVNNFTDEDFIVWMRTATFPKFRKLHRRIEGGLTAGKYQIIVENRYPVQETNGEKSVIIGTTCWIGGANYVLGVTYICVAGVSLILALSFFLKHYLSPRKFGNGSYSRLEVDDRKEEHRERQSVSIEVDQ